MASLSSAGTPEAVTVIVPTLARTARTTRLLRALSSIRDQEGVRPLALVIVNGPERDVSLVQSITRMKDVRVASIPGAHLGNALQEGRRQVDSPWFAELDDDDILLPGALARGVARLKGSNATAVVSNGWAEVRGWRRPVIEDVALVASDPLAALQRALWLSPGGAVFRTEAIGPDAFDGLPRFLEWTCLALRLAVAYRLEFTSDPGFVHFEDSDDSLWASAECVLGLPDSIRHLLVRDVPLPLRALFLRRFAAACNSAARLEHARGRLREAWRWHLRCVAAGGWRYLGFTRRLLARAEVDGL
jgi:glycosyltransferase involved in cell wall biosynthesis